MSGASGSAHGKVILLGEHVVVYGAPAIAAGIDRGARAHAVANDGASVLRLGGDVIPADATSTDDRARAFAALLSEAGAAPAVSVDASSELPPGGGLGSSAALGVAIARAVIAVMAEASGEPIDDAVAVARASAWERVFHGNPSGIDTAAAAAGGCFRFARATGIARIVPARDLHVCIGHSGDASSTKVMVDGVARFRARRPEIVDRAIAGVAALVDNAVLAIETGDVHGLGRLMDLNQMLLAGLMLSTESLERLCSLARTAGALGAKLTGAGGGGSAIALVNGMDLDAESRVLAAWKNAGYDGFSTRIRAEEATS